MLQSNEIADREDIRHPSRPGAAPIRVAKLLRPGHLFDTQLDTTPGADVDLRLAAGGAGHQPGRQVRDPRDGLEIGVHVGIRSAVEIDLGLGAAIAVASVVIAQRPAHRRLRGALQPRIDRGGHPKALAEGFLAVMLDNGLARHLRDVTRVEIRLTAMQSRHIGRQDRNLVLLPVDLTQLEHAREDVVASLECALGIGDGVVAGRRLRNAGQHRRLGGGELVELLVVIKRGRGRDAVGAVTEKDLIQIQIEDLILRQGSFDLQREQDLGELALEGLLRAEQEVAGHLHR